MQAFHIKPVPAPRMTRRDSWKPRDCVLRYRAYCDDLEQQGSVTLYPTMFIAFYMPMPDSWSEKKKAKFYNQPHTQTPDLDNLVKGFLDAPKLNDCGVHTILAVKKWAYNGAISYGEYLINQEHSPILL